jgi:hypothetical protein
MTTVFIGGSRHITRLTSDVHARLDRIVGSHLPVLVGDASGADKAVQAYLADRHYAIVEVFCSDESPRNNLGGWPLRVVRPTRTARDFEYYATKDRAMAAEATVGLMLWDGESRGTLLNVVRLAAQGKPVVVYNQRGREFTDVRSRQEFDKLTSTLDGTAARRFNEQAAAEGFAAFVTAQPTLRM